MEYYNKLEDPTDEENDMLDLAFGLSEKYVPLPWNWTADCIAVQASLKSILILCCRSRLSCQLIAEHTLDGIRLALPSATWNVATYGYKENNFDNFVACLILVNYRSRPPKQLVHIDHALLLFCWWTLYLFSSSVPCAFVALHQCRLALLMWLLVNPNS